MRGLQLDVVVCYVHYEAAFLGGRSDFEIPRLDSKGCFCEELICDSKELDRRYAFCYKSHNLV